MCPQVLLASRSKRIPWAWELQFQIHTGQGKGVTMKEWWKQSIRDWPQLTFPLPLCCSGEEIKEVEWGKVFVFCYKGTSPLTMFHCFFFFLNILQKFISLENSFIGLISAIYHTSNVKEVALSQGILEMCKSQRNKLNPVTLQQK